MNNQYHSQFVQLEADLISARHLYTSKSNEYISISEQLAKSDISNNHLLYFLLNLGFEKPGFLRYWLVAQELHQIYQIF